MRSAALGWVCALVCVVASAAPAATQGAVLLMPPSDEDPGIPAVAVAPAGPYVAAWSVTQIGGSLRFITGDLRTPAFMPDVRRLPADVESEPTVAVGDDGSAAIAWFDPIRNRYGGTTEVGSAMVAWRTSGASPWVTQRLSRDQPIGEDVPLAVLGPQGRAVVVWIVEGRHHDSVVVARRPPGATRFAQPHAAYVEPTSGGAYRFEAAFDGSGRLTLAWTRGEVDDDEAIAVSARRARDARVLVPEAVKAMSERMPGSFGRAQTIATLCVEPHLGVAASGAAAITMICTYAGDDDFDLMAAQRLPDQPFGAPAVINRRGEDDYGDQLAVTADGRATVTWVHRPPEYRPNPDYETTRVYATETRLGTPFPRAHAVTPYTRSGDDEDAALAPNPFGDPLFADLGAHGHLTVARLAPGAVLGPAVRPAGTGDVLGYALDGDQSGRGLVVWEGYPHRGLDAATFTVPGTARSSAETRRRR
jgi:hypothetical protein